MGGPNSTATLRKNYSTKPGGDTHQDTVFHVGQVHPFRLSCFGLEMDRNSAHYLWERVGLLVWTLTEQDHVDSILRL